ncbi:MAG TPA: nitrilase-related carbon-nitrogen hydrolase, partial [Stellaceae bacterium]|nr:nitrilase-related carbon-nitrogen hydrolase [Stellaceae bacterium]
MTDRLAIAIAQIDPTVGDVAGNVAALKRAHAEAAQQRADLVVASELCIAGYPPEDLVLKPAFVAACEEAAAELAAVTRSGPGMVVGSPWREGGKTYNAALLLEGGRVASVRFKHELPNYGVFDEKRTFAIGAVPGPIAFRGVRLGVMVCEDMWFADVSETLQETGAELLIVINGSPFESDKRDERIALAAKRVRENGLPLLYVNQVCGQDELVFDGASFALDAEGRLRVQAPDWREAVLTTKWRRGDDGTWTVEPGTMTPQCDGFEA